MIKRVLMTLLGCMWASAAAAEWQLAPQGGWVSDQPTARGTAESGTTVLSITCRQGAPFLFTLGYPAKPGAERIEAFVVDVDGQRFAPEGLHVPPDGLWTAVPSGSLIDALRAGSVARVTPPGQATQTVPLRGSSRAITGALADCGPVNAQSAPASGRILQFGQLIAEACGGGYRLAEGAELTGDLDGDGREDVVLDWAGVTCDDRSKGRGAGFCGAALCRIEVLLSGPPTVQQLTGHKPRLLNRAFGRVALQTTTMGRSCGGGAQTCMFDWRFDGQKLEPVR